MSFRRPFIANPTLTWRHREGTLGNGSLGYCLHEAACLMGVLLLRRRAFHRLYLVTVFDDCSSDLSVTSSKSITPSLCPGFTSITPVLVKYYSAVLGGWVRNLSCDFPLFKSEPSTAGDGSLPVTGASRLPRLGYSAMNGRTVWR